MQTITKVIVVLLISLLSQQLISQTTIHGTVVDVNKKPIKGANIYLEGTYDGSSSNDNGSFSFETEAVGNQILVISFLAYETKKMVGDLTSFKNVKVILQDDVNTLDAVVLSAGTFSAGDNSKVSVLKPLDIVTTASALGDFVGALQTLPGTTTVAEDGRLFVRGGEAEETQIFIDGIRVFTPYTPTTNNAPTRGRYSPFLFDGISFSTGGYSAEYGQALSSILLLNTINEPGQEKTDVGIMSVGGALGNTKKWKNSSLSVNASYINLAPYIGIFPDRNDWKKPYEALSGETVFRHKTANGLFKLYSAFDSTNFSLTQEDINHVNGMDFKLKNNNLYFNSSYKGMLNDVWNINSGLSYTRGKTNLNIIDNKIADIEHSFHAKLKLKRRFSSRFKLNLGIEYFSTNFNELFESSSISKLNYGFNNNIAAAFAESDVFFSKKLALKVGVRAEYSILLNALSLAPRLSLAYQIAPNSQVSLAYGDFYQNPTNAILKYNQALKAQQTTHYILNYQYNNNGKVFRAEGYYKNYNNLVKYDTGEVSFGSNYKSQGYGFAKGIDLFFRDNKSIKNIDYWLSYSFLDTKRNYKNFNTDLQPSFVNKHNISLVGKYWIDKLKSQVGMSYSFASGRTYTNPNETGMLNTKTKPYNSLSVNWAYLISQQKILYFSINNVLGIKNVNGYQYTNTPDLNGAYNRRALRPAADQFFFVGFFWTISEKGTDNQLNNL